MLVMICVRTVWKGYHEQMTYVAANKERVIASLKQAPVWCKQIQQICLFRKGVLLRPKNIFVIGYMKRMESWKIVFYFV